MTCPDAPIVYLNVKINIPIYFRYKSHVHLNQGRDRNKEALKQANAEVRTRLRQTRKAIGITQAQLVSVAGTNRAVIQKIEIGKTIRPRMVGELAVALEVNPARLQWGSRLR